MRVFPVGPDGLHERADRPAELPAGSFVWTGSTRDEFEAATPAGASFTMIAVGAGLAGMFWRQRYLGTRPR